MKERNFDVLDVELFIRKVRDDPAAIAHGFVLKTASGDTRWCAFPNEVQKGGSVEPPNESVLEGVLDMLRKNEGSGPVGAFALKESCTKRLVVALFDYFDDRPDKVSGLAREEFERRVRKDVLNCAVEYLQSKKPATHVVDVEYTARERMIIKPKERSAKKR